MSYAEEVWLEVGMGWSGVRGAVGNFVCEEGGMAVLVGVGAVDSVSEAGSGS